MVRRGDVFYARLNPVEGSEQQGTRPVVVVSRNAINENSPVIIIVPVSTRKSKRKVYPSQVILKAGDGDLPMESVVLGEQVRAINKTRLGERLGHLSESAMRAISVCLKIALDLS